MLMGQLTPFRPYQVLLVCELQLWCLKYFFVVVSYPCYRVMYLFLPVVWCNAIMFLWVSIPWKSDFLQKEQAHQDIQGCPKSLGFSKKKDQAEAAIRFMTADSFSEVTHSDSPLSGWWGSVPSTSKMLLTVVLLAASHCVKPLWCAFKSRLLSYKDGVLCSHRPLPWQHHHFWSLLL